MGIHGILPYGTPSAGGRGGSGGSQDGSVSRVVRGAGRRGAVVCRPVVSEPTVLGLWIRTCRCLERFQTVSSRYRTASNGT